jgi:hypothetical protein
MSDLETETTSDTDTATFEHFGRTWTVPIRRHHKHIRATKAILRSEGSLDADDVASIYLPADEYEALVGLDVTSDDLDVFATEIAKCLGMGSSGNSSPSATSS